MKMSAKQADHRNFLSSLRSRLNVDDRTIANLELRMAGKSHFDASQYLPKIWPYTFSRMAVVLCGTSIFCFLLMWNFPAASWRPWGDARRIVALSQSIPLGADFRSDSIKIFGCYDLNWFHIIRIKSVIPALVFFLTINLIKSLDFNKALLIVKIWLEL